MLHNNWFPLQLIDKFQKKQGKKGLQIKYRGQISHKGKCVTITLFGGENYHITEFFRRATLCIAYKTKNSIQHYLNSTLQISNKDKFKKAAFTNYLVVIVINYIQNKLVIVLKQVSKNIFFHLRIIITILNVTCFRKNNYFVKMEDMKPVYYDHKGRYLDRLKKLLIYKEPIKGIQLSHKTLLFIKKNIWFCIKTRMKECARWN
jgi:hypothetical protein